MIEDMYPPALMRIELDAPMRAYWDLQDDELDAHNRAQGFNTYYVREMVELPAGHGGRITTLHVVRNGRDVGTAMVLLDGIPTLNEIPRYMLRSPAGRVIRERDR
jgi:hypothetical protein